MRSIVLVLTLAGCYGPTVALDLPCSAQGECPAGQTCDPVRRICGIGPGIDGPLLVDAAFDAPMIDAAPDAFVPLGPWSTPVPALPSVTADVTDPALSADGLELFFSITNVPNYQIYRATRATTTTAFSNPMLVTELATPNEESGAFLTGDGLTLYFRSEGDIYRATRPDRNSPFGTRVRDTGLSSAASDYDPAISDDGLVAVIARDVAPDDRELFMFTRATAADPWNLVGQLTNLSSGANESGAHLGATGAQMYFHSEGLAATPNIFVTTRAGTTYGAAMPVTEINTADDEGDPTLTADGRTMVFRRETTLYLTTR